MSEDRPEQAEPSRRGPSRVLRPLVDRSRGIVAAPVQQTEAHLMQRVDELEERLAARLQSIADVLEVQQSEAADAVHEQRLLYVSVRHLLEEQAEELSALRREVASLRDAVPPREPAR